MTEWKWSLSSLFEFLWCKPLPFTFHQSSVTIAFVRRAEKWTQWHNVWAGQKTVWRQASLSSTEHLIYWCDDQTLGSVFCTMVSGSHVEIRSIDLIWPVHELKLQYVTKSCVIKPLGPGLLMWLHCLRIWDMGGRHWVYELCISIMCIRAKSHRYFAELVSSQPVHTWTLFIPMFFTIFLSASPDKLARHFSQPIRYVILDVSRMCSLVKEWARPYSSICMCEVNAHGYKWIKETQHFGI